MRLFTIDNICNDQYRDSPRWGVVMAEDVEDAIEQAKKHLGPHLEDTALSGEGLNRTHVEVRPDSVITCLSYYWYYEGCEVGVDEYNITPVPGTIHTIVEEELF